MHILFDFNEFVLYEWCERVVYACKTKLKPTKTKAESQPATTNDNQK